MRMEEVEINSIISAARFLNEYVLPLYGSKLDACEIKSMKNLSHLDLDELGIPIVKRCSDEEAKKNPGVILVGAKGRSHRGYEVHGYYRPSVLYQNELLEKGLSDEEIASQIIGSVPEYYNDDFKYLTDKPKEKVKTKKKTKTHDNNHDHSKKNNKKDSNKDYKRNKRDYYEKESRNRRGIEEW